MDEDVRAIWEHNASLWTRAVRERLIPSRRAVTDGAVLAAVTALRPRRLLDVGCGEGWLCRAVAEAVPDCAVTGVDGIRALVEAARTADPGGDYHLMTYADLEAGAPGLEAGFDLAVFNYCLFDIHVARLLRAVADLLMPERGRVVIQTVHPAALPDDAPYADHWRKEDFRSLESGTWAAMPWLARTVGSWVTVLGEAGLRLETLEEPALEPGGRPVSLVMTAREA